MILQAKENSAILYIDPILREQSQQAEQMLQR
jgi:hypothetical protein